MLRKALFSLFLLISGTLLAQPQSEKPISWELGLEEVSPIELPPIDLTQVMAEDSINDLDKSIPWRYGVVRSIIAQPDEDGKWVQLPNGDRIWRVAIKSPEALNLAVNFNEFELPQGSSLQFYNNDKSDYSKIYTSEHNRSSSLLGSWFITGEVIIVEYYQPLGVFTPPSIEIANVIHGYRMGKVNDLVDSMGTRGLEDSGDCNYDVNCSVGSDFESKKNMVKKAVALLNLGNGRLCTAVLVNNGLQDKTPYLLTANHCLQDSDPALWSVRFNWVSPDPICGTEEESADLQTNFTMSGAEVRASNALTDFAIVELYNSIPAYWDVAFAGWDNTDSVPEFQVGIHHPSGDIMKICRDDDSAMKDVANGTQVWLIKGQSSGNGNGWDLGITESGSSGSPLFNQDGLIIGQLYAGLSNCLGTETNEEFDLYGRFGVSWDAGNDSSSRLKDWLDPGNIGLTTMPAMENSLNIGEFEFTGRLEVYPNPASDYIEVLNTRYPNLRYELFNVAGQRLQSGDLFSSQNILKLSQFSEGVYFLHLVDGDSENSITKKVVIQHR